jgi:hypothetical protein
MLSNSRRVFLNDLLANCLVADIAGDQHRAPSLQLDHPPRLFCIFVVNGDVRSLLCERDGDGAPNPAVPPVMIATLS